MVTGFVLAGGLSSRMGTDKALLPLSGDPLAALAVRKLREVCGRVVVIGNASNLKELNRLKADGVIEDLAPEQGPLMGIYTGLMHTQTRLNVFAACDMPFVQSARVAEWLTILGGKTRVIAGSHAQAGVFPLPLVCTTDLLVSVGGLLNQNKRSLQRLFSLDGARLCALSDADVQQAYVNVNEPGDYALLSQR